MTNEQLQTTGYIVVAGEKKIESITYREYINEYGKDETTTPRGIGDRLHTREVEVLSNEYEVDNEDAEPEYTTQWQMWSWGAGGNHPSHCGPDFDTEEEAELYYYERSKWYVQEKNWNAPIFWNSKEEAIEDLANITGKSIEVMERYINWSEKATAKAKIAEKERQVAWELQKNKLKEAVQAEAALITVDTEFQKDIDIAMTLNGMAKNDFCAKAMTDFLKRNNIEKINSDFWQVFRILKARVN